MPTFSLAHDTLYNDYNTEIQNSLFQDTNAVSESDIFQPFKQSQVADIFLPEQVDDPYVPPPSPPKPEFLSAAEVASMPEDKEGVDYRPHLIDKVSGLVWLCDSGSAVTALPPDPGDTPVPGMFLKAVNGARIKCYGFKQIEVKIGRKPFHFISEKKYQFFKIIKFPTANFYKFYS